MFCGRAGCWSAEQQAGEGQLRHTWNYVEPVLTCRPARPTSSTIRLCRMVSFMSLPGDHTARTSQDIPVPGEQISTERGFYDFYSNSGIPCLNSMKEWISTGRSGAYNAGACLQTHLSRDSRATWCIPRNRALVVVCISVCRTERATPQQRTAYQLKILGSLDNLTRRAISRFTLHSEVGAGSRDSALATRRRDPLPPWSGAIPTK